MSLTILRRYWNSQEQTILFDFASTQHTYTYSSYNIKTSVDIYQNQNNQLIITDKSDNTTKTIKRTYKNEYLLTVIKKNNIFYLHQEKSLFSLNQKINKLWMIINFSYYNDTKQFDDKYGYCLHEGEIIRLGKVIFKVIQIKIIEDEERLKIKKKGIISNSEMHSMNNSNISNIKSNNKPNSKLNTKIHLKTNHLLIQSNNTNDCRQCRICFGDSNEDVLISVCKCIGSVKYIHIKCLYKWIAKKVSLKTYNHLTIYSHTKLKCEICKAEIPELIKIKGDLINLYEPYKILLYHKEENAVKFKHFLVLQYLNEDFDSDNESKIEENKYFILNFLTKKSLVLGRGLECDIKMTSNTISHQHSIFIYNNNKLYLNDLNSRYGTHVLLNNYVDFPILHNGFLGIQCGKTFFCFQARRNLYDCLCQTFSFRKGKNKKNTIEDYYEELDKKKKIIEKGILEYLCNVNIEEEKDNNGLSRADTHSKIHVQINNMNNNEKEYSYLQRESDANLILKSAINDSDNNNITNINNHSINGCRLESNIINNNIDSSTNNNIKIKPNLVRIGKHNPA